MLRAGISGGVLVALSLGVTPLRAEQVPRSELKQESQAQSAADAKPDEELLEFLGSVDAEDQDWVEYLTDIEVERPAAARPAPQVEKDEKDE